MTTLALTAGDQAAQAHRVVRRTRVLFVLFFLAGFPPVIYQLAWQRPLSEILGGGVAAAAILVAGFMLGLGLGSLAGGWLSTRRNIPLWLLLAAIELASAACGIRVPADSASRARRRPVAHGDDRRGALPAGSFRLCRWGDPAVAVVGHPVRRSGHCGKCNGPNPQPQQPRRRCGVPCLLLLDFRSRVRQARSTWRFAINVAAAAGALILHCAAVATPSAPTRRRLPRSRPARPCWVPLHVPCCHRSGFCGAVF